MSGPHQNRRTHLGLRVLDWTKRTYLRTPHTRVVWPDLGNEDPLAVTRIYRWLQEFREPQEILVYSAHPEQLRAWWDDIPTYMNWARDMSQGPRMGLLAVVRSQADVASVVAMQAAGFPMRRLILQCFPREKLTLPPCDAIWVGHKDTEWYTSYITREEWVEDLRRQAGDTPFAFKAWGTWWPARYGGRAFAERDGYIRGPSPPKVDQTLNATYPSWVVKD